MHLVFSWFTKNCKFGNFYINNCPTRCNTKQSIYYSASSLYMFLVSTTPIIRGKQNCNLQPPVLVIFFFVQLPPFNVAGGSCTKNMTSTGPSNVAKVAWPLPVLVIFFCAATSLQHGQASLTSTGGCSYSFVYSWWWVWLTPETCRVNLQNNK